MSKSIVKVGPADHGKRMSLEDFDKAEAQEGQLYELSRGVIHVSDVPRRRHLAQVKTLGKQINAYDPDHAVVVGESKRFACLTPIQQTLCPALS